MAVCGGWKRCCFRGSPPTVPLPAKAVSLPGPPLFPAHPSECCPIHTIYCRDVHCMSTPFHVPYWVQRTPPPTFKKVTDKFVQKNRAKPCETVGNRPNRLLCWMNRHLLLKEYDRDTIHLLEADIGIWSRAQRWLETLGYMAGELHHVTPGLDGCGPLELASSCCKTWTAPLGPEQEATYPRLPVRLNFPP